MIDLPTAEIQKELMNVRAAHFHKMAYISFNAALSLWPDVVLMQWRTTLVSVRHWEIKIDALTHCIERHW